MAAMIQIRNVPEPVHRVLKACAAPLGKSLSGVMLDEPQAMAALPSPEELHGIDFDDAVIAREDPLALTMLDPDSNGEVRFVSMGRDPKGRLLVTIFTQRGQFIRVISSRRATPNKRRTFGEKA